MDETTEVAPISPQDIWGIKTDPAASTSAPAEEGTEDATSSSAEPSTPEDGGQKGAPAVEAPTTEDPEETDDFVQFFGKVQEITGDNIEGEFDNTVEGIASYITAAKTDAVNATFNRIQAEDPRAYAYLVHRANGGTDSDFFQATGNANLPTIEQVRSNPAVQEHVLKNYYASKGMTDREANLLVRAAQDDDRLATSAEEILGKQLGDEAARSKDFIAQQAADKASLDQAVAQTANYIESVVQKGDLNGWAIPKNHQQEFLNYLDARFDYVGGKPYLKVELTDDNLKGELQAQYLAYRKGNLGDLVKREAGTQQAQKLRMKASESNKPKRGPSSEGTGPKTMASIW